MGSRGMFKASGEQGILEEFREYSEVGVLEGIKIIQDDVRTNNSTIIYSNTPDTAYYSFSKEFRRIEHIYHFRNHRLYKSVDFKPDGTEPHAHYWEQVNPGRKRHDKKNIHSLTPHDKRLMKIALEYNEKLMNDGR